MFSKSSTAKQGQYFQYFDYELHLRQDDYDDKVEDLKRWFH